MNIRVIIPSYKREESLYNLCQKLAIEASRVEGLKIDIQVWFDGCEYSNVHPDITDGRNVEHFGKHRHWELCDLIFKNQQGTKFDLFIWLPDDAILVNNFFVHALRIWKAIQDPDKICLNLLMDKARRGKANWTGFVPRLERFGKEKIYLSQWVDMCFLFSHDLLSLLNYKITPIGPERWKRDPKLSSGVGQQISYRLVRKKKRLYQVNKSLIKTGHLKSVMNPWRKPFKWED